VYPFEGVWYVYNGGVFELSIGSKCVQRGILDIERKRLNTSDIFKSDHAGWFRSHLGSVDITTLLHTNGLSLSSSFPTRFLPTSGSVEVIRVHTDREGLIQSLSYSFKEAIGAPLFTAAIVDVASPIIATGPFISEKELKLSTGQDKPENEPQEESPSFLRKYWWVIAGFFLLSSVLGSGNQDQGGQAASRDNTS
jgi:hypothetical protein